MGIGLTSYIPLVLYIAGLLCIPLSLIYTPLFGIFFLFPLLPYSSVILKMSGFWLGKDLLNLVMLSILAGWVTQKNKKADHTPLLQQTPMNAPIKFMMIASFVSFMTGCFSGNFEVQYLVDWKDHMLLPLICLVTMNTITDKKALKQFMFVLVLGVVGISFYYFDNLKWMNLTHFSYRVRDSFEGIFLYLGQNHYGAFFAHMLCIILGLAYFDRRTLRKYALLGVVGLLVYCVMYTFSRGAYLGLLLGLLFMGIVKDKKLVLLIVVFLLFWKSIVPVSVVERVEMTRTEDGELESSAADRVVLWDHALEMFAGSPLFGRGFNTFESNGYRDTHNYYLKMLAEQGLLGFLAFLFILFRGFKTGWALFRNANDTLFKGLGLGFAASIIAAAVTNFFGDRWSYLSMGSYYWLFMGIVTSAYMITIKEGSAAAGTAEPPSTERGARHARYHHPGGGRP